MLLITTSFPTVRCMPKGGLEPPRPCEHNALNVACLPISPLRLFIYLRVLIPLRPAILILPSHLDLDTHYNTVSLPTCQEFFSPLLLFHPHQNTYGTNGPPSLTVDPDTSTLVTGGSIETIASSHQKHEQLVALPAASHLPSSGKIAETPWPKGTGGSTVVAPLSTCSERSLDADQENFKPTDSNGSEHDRV